MLEVDGPRDMFWPSRALLSEVHQEERFAEIDRRQAGRVQSLKSPLAAAEQLSRTAKSLPATAQSAQAL